jgi:PAS domain-containing protein
MRVVQYVLRDAAGKVVGVLSMVHDVTGRKMIEAELSESKKFLQTVIEASPNVLNSSMQTAA